MDNMTFLYPVKAAAGPCTRLAQCGGHSFLIRACRLVVYFFIFYYFIFYSLKYYIIIINSLL